MKTIIAGSRGITDIDTVVMAVFSSGFDITKVLSGGAQGVDKLGEQVARDLEVELEVFQADWATHGNKAGYLRNVVMSSKADALIAVWDGKSKGTKHMIDIATKDGLKVFVYNTAEN